MTRLSRYSQVILVTLVALLAVLLWVALQQANNIPTIAAVVNQLSTFTTIFLGIFIEAFPFLLIGTFASGLVEVFVNKDDLARLIPRQPVLAALMGTLLGFAFPVCECGVVPLTRRLLHKGLPLSASVSFLLAAPVLNPIVIASTLAAFGWGAVLAWRVGLSFAIALLVGIIFAFQKDPLALLNPAAFPKETYQPSAESIALPLIKPSLTQRLQQAALITRTELFDMGRYLVIGGLLAALMQTVVPRTWLLSFNQGPLLPILALMVLAVVLSVCSTVDAFIALAFSGSFHFGAILAFLVFGPMVDIKSTLLYLGVFRRKTVLYIILLPLVMVIFATLLINIFWG